MKRNRTKGSGLIEFALGFSVLVLLFIGMARIAYTMIVMTQLSSAVQGAARYAANAPVQDRNALEAGIRNVVVYGRPVAGAGNHVQAPGLRPDQVAITWERDAAGMPAAVTVTLRHYRVPVLFRETELDGHPSATARLLSSWSSAALTSSR